MINSYTKSSILFLSLLIFPISVSASEMPPPRGSIISSDDQILAVADPQTNRRVYPSLMSLTPLLGFTLSDNKGSKGLEKYGDEYLANGYDMHLNIDISLQQKVEMILDKAKDELQAEGFIAAVMQSDTGKILAMGSFGALPPC